MKDFRLDPFAKICGPSRSFAFQKEFDANGPEHSRMAANLDELKDEFPTQMATDKHRFSPIIGLEYIS